jgi:lipopolysaccharide/colanic/teichoic acid biosynthesis glycosyltransferase
LDRVLAALLIVLFAPVMAVVALAIWLWDGRPILFVQERPGYKGEIFKIYKFRTMTNEKDDRGELLPDDERLKGVGKIIRSMSLDELPQLFNVLKGEMSFVGPRPLLKEYLPLYSERQRKRNDVKPGITGWAQVNGRNLLDWSTRFEYDLWYVEHCSFWLDLKIFWLTLVKVFKREGIAQPGRATMEKFRGNGES